MKSVYTKGIVILLIAAVLGAFFYFDIGSYLSLAELKNRQGQIQSLVTENTLEFVLGFGAVYIACAALSIPGATVLTLAAGLAFGLLWGTVFVSICSTIGATLSFLASRFLLRDFVAQRFGQRLKAINQGVEKEGAFYLLALRLVPAFPFFLVNLAMGLTPIRTMTFAFVSQIGMLPGTAAYVNAGTQLSQIESLKGLLSPSLLLSFTAIGILPFVAKAAIRWWKSHQVMKRFKKPANFDYNVVVIGAGSAGLVTSYIAAAVKAKVALIEKHKMGGDCLNTGCVPSKALIRSAKIFSYIGRANEFGLQTGATGVDFAKVMERVQNVVKKVEPHDSVERYSSLGVECIQGEAKIISPYEVRVGNRTLTAKNIVVATGARPLVPQIPGLSEIKFLTSDNVWDLRIQPKRLLVLGGGPIGCELAQSFNRLGSKVTIVEKAPRLMVREDADVSECVSKIMAHEGLDIRTNHSAVRFGQDQAGKFLICQSDGKEIRIEFDEVLLALGRRANVTGFGLEELGVKIVDGRGTIEVNEFLQTNYPNIFACGDVAGPYQFTHTAAHMAWFASVNALFGSFKKFAVDYRVIPWCTFTDPEVARVGLNETEAKEKGIPYEVTVYHIDDLDRAIAESAEHGFVKVLTPPGKDTILGATIVGHHAGDIIVEYVSAMKYGFGMNKILGTIHIYPTLGEANKYAAGVWKKAHAPADLLRWVEKFHAWRRA
ncbi:MAG: FAD-dependent oxidoreductase [Bdellovibrionota bacterium]